MGFLSGIGRMFGGTGGQMRQPRIQDFGKGFGAPTGGGLSPVADQPYMQGPSSLPQMGQQPMSPPSQMSEIAGMFGGGSQPTPWTPPMMDKPQGGFNLGQAAQGSMGAMNALGGQQQQEQQRSPFSWFGQFQPWR